MKTYLVRISSDIVGSFWWLVRSESEETAMNAISSQTNLSRQNYTFSIDDLDSVLSQQYDGCAELSYCL